jgi:hypothetical protein
MCQLWYDVYAESIKVETKLKLKGLSTLSTLYQLFYPLHGYQLWYKVFAESIKSWCKVVYQLCINFVSTFCIHYVTTVLKSSYWVDKKFIQRCVNCVSTLYRLFVSTITNFDTKYIQSRQKVFCIEIVSTSIQIYYSVLEKKLQSWYKVVSIFCIVSGSTL